MLQPSSPINAPCEKQRLVHLSYLCEEAKAVTLPSNITSNGLHVNELMQGQCMIKLQLNTHVHLLVTPNGYCSVPSNLTDITIYFVI